ncbi:MAG: ABC transporter ATP-binding protein [Alphaproteobacteria bacterium]
MPEYFRQLWEILDPAARRGAIVVLLTMILAGVLEVLGIGLILPILEMAINPDKGLTTQPFMQRIYDALGFRDTTSFMMAISLALFMVYLVKNLFAMWAAHLRAKYTFDLLARMTRHLFVHYLHAPYAVHVRRNSAKLLRNINLSMQEVFAGLLMPLLMIVSDAITSGAILLFLVWLQPWITLLAAVLLLGVGVVFNRTLRHRLRDWGRRIQTAREGMVLWPSQAFGGMKQIKALGREDYFAKAFKLAADENSRCNQWFSVLGQVPRAALEVIAIGGILLTLTIILSSGRDLGELIPLLGVFSLALIRVLPTVSRIIAQINNLKIGIAALDTIYDDLRDLPPEQTTASPDAVKTIGLRRELTIEGLSFAYEESDGPVLTDINMSIAQGESIALVGESGAGKSTLADLLLGLLDPTAGRILADGVDIAGDLRGWRAGIGYIPQEAFLTDDTVRRNIALGIDDDDIDEDAISRAMAMAQLSEVIEGIPNGLDTVLGEHGVRLSGGQRQRVSIARTLYNDPGVLILDEATSALDNETEREITRSIDNLKGGKTLIIIAHRLSTVRHCDRLMLMGGGKILDSGGFDELFRRNDTFRRMVELAEIRPGHQLDSDAEQGPPELAN